MLVCFLYIINWDWEINILSQISLSKTDMVLEQTLILVFPLVLALAAKSYHFRLCLVDSSSSYPDLAEVLVPFTKALSPSSKLRQPIYMLPWLHHDPSTHAEARRLLCTPPTALPSPLDQNLASPRPLWPTTCLAGKDSCLFDHCRGFATYVWPYWGPSTLLCLPCLLMVSWCFHKLCQGHQLSCWSLLHFFACLQQ